MDDETAKYIRESRKEVQDLMARTRLYALFALIFVSVGAMLFAYIYFAVYGGKMTTVASPVSLIIIVVMFVPAGILAFLSKKSEKKAMNLVKDIRDKI